jgi:hypothetical protein
MFPSLSQLPVIPLPTQAHSLAWQLSLSVDDGLPSARVLEPEWICIVERRHLGPLIASLPEYRWARGPRPVRATVGG